MTAAGIALSTYAAGALRKVPAHHDSKPGRSFDLGERLGGRVVEWVRDRYDGEGPDLASIAHRIPMQVYDLLTKDELCKIRASSVLMMDESVEEAFRTDPLLSLHRKIASSMWRWGVGRGGWNETVDAFEGIRGFSFGHPDFEVTLDHTTGYNECGYSEHSRTFLDGVFGYLVHHRGEHVMTLGFSLMKGRRLLLQQVQLKSRRGNRWLFKLPRNYLEHVIDRFAEAFPRHRIHLVDGADVVGKSLGQYRAALAEAERYREEALERLDRCEPDMADYYRQRAGTKAEEAARLRECIAHAKPEVARLGGFYAATGRYARGAALTVNRLTHYELAPATHSLAMAA